MPLNNHTLILAAIAILAIGQGAIFYKLANISAGTDGIPTTFQQDGPEIPGSSENFTVGTVAEPEGEVVFGVVASIDSSAIVLETEDGTETYTITPQAEIVATTPKTEAEINADLDVYNARVAELMENPEGNRQVLENLEFPSPITETPTSLSSIQTNQPVTLFLNDSGAVVKVAVQG